MEDRARKLLEANGARQRRPITPASDGGNRRPRQPAISPSKRTLAAIAKALAEESVREEGSESFVDVLPEEPIPQAAEGGLSSGKANAWASPEIAGARPAARAFHPSLPHARNTPSHRAASAHLCTLSIRFTSSHPFARHEAPALWPHEDHPSDRAPPNIYSR
jgi:hypothetical protein